MALHRPFVAIDSFNDSPYRGQHSYNEITHKTMKLIKIEVEGATQEEIKRYEEILGVLLKVGGLDGVKSGKTIINFDANGVFMGINLDYWPWKRRT